ncbi:MAG TPA: histidine kinase [Clostridiales bacterium]|nr:histidine kinase [Clostridiales bacterium]
MAKLINDAINAINIKKTSSRIYSKIKKVISNCVNNVSSIAKESTGIFKKTDTRQQFIILFAFSTIVLVATVCIISSAYSNTILGSNEKYINNVVTQYKNEFTHNLSEIDQLVNGLAYNPAVKNYLTIKDNPYQRHVYASELITYFYYLKSVKVAIKDMTVFRLDAGKVTYYDSIRPESLIVDLFDQKPHSYCYGVVEYGGEHGGRHYRNLLSGCSVYNKNYLTDEVEKIGTIVVSIDPYGLSIKLEELEGVESVKYMVYDEKNNIVIGNIDTNNAEIADIINKAENNHNANHFETKRYKLNIVEVEGLRGRILTIVDKNLLLGPVKQAVFFSGLILFIAIILLVLMYYLAAGNIVMPINDIIVFLQTMRKEDISKLDKRIPIVGNKDIRLFSLEFNNALDEINALTYKLIDKNSRLYEMEITKKQSEIALLRSQINPHFLYNTLEAIRSIAVIRDVPEIKDISRSLARIMKYSIKGYENVTLAEELGIIKDYIQIQNTRFDNKFSTEFIIEPEALACTIPKMTLQPIVENAISHGLELTPDAGHLLLHAYIENENRLVVRIVDDGVGIDEADLASITEKLESEDYSFYLNHRAGIGLVNVNSRIKLTQGKNYGVKVKSQKDKGTEVTISFLAEVSNNV